MLASATCRSERPSPPGCRRAQLMDFYGDFYQDFRRDAAEEMLKRLEISPRQRIKQMSKGTREKVQLIMVMSRAAQAVPAG